MHPPLSVPSASDPRPEPLDLDTTRQIVLLLTYELQRRFAPWQIALQITDPAVTHVAQSAPNPAFDGAGPLKRYLQQALQGLIGRLIMNGQAVPGSTLRIEYDRAHAGLSVHVLDAAPGRAAV